MTRRACLAALSGGLVRAQAPPPVQWVCPMDPEVRSSKPDRCGKCGMQLVAGLPGIEEYTVDMRMQPAAPNPGDRVKLTFRVRTPNGKADAKLQLIHEKLFHLFLVSRDLSVFRHEHPELQPDGTFVHHTVLPQGGMYRLLCDFYPEGGTPQMIAKTLFARGGGPAARLEPDLSAKTTENLGVSLRLDPPQPLAGKKTMLFCELDPATGLEQYLGAWGHLLAASLDLVDIIHTHPAWEEGGPNVQFNLIFPRPGVHRVWVQFQRQGVVNTARFDVPVIAL
jgi:hypothetical protein